MRLSRFHVDTRISTHATYRATRRNRQATGRATRERLGPLQAHQAPGLHKTRRTTAVFAELRPLIATRANELSPEAFPQIEALKAHEIDLFWEVNLRRWARQYTGPKFGPGKLLTKAFPTGQGTYHSAVAAPTLSSGTNLPSLIRDIVPSKRDSLISRSSEARRCFD